MNMRLTKYLLCLAAVGSPSCATKDVGEVPAEVVTDLILTTDAAIAEPEAVAITTAPTGTHLDGDATYQPVGYAPTVPRNARTKSKTIELVLRSSPPGATASIDGKTIGVTPTFWSGKADQRAHEFTFVKAGFSMARYRFVATHSGIVHGSLTVLQKNDEAPNKP